MTGPGAVTFRQLSDADGALIDELNARCEIGTCVDRIAFEQNLKHVYVVEEDGVPVGVVGLVRNSTVLGLPEGYHLICVLTKAAEGRHLGTIACATILDLETATPPNGVFAIIPPANEKAEALARNLGFTRTEGTTERRERIWFRG